LLLYCSWDKPNEIIKLIKKDFIKYGKNSNTKFLVIIDPWTTTRPMCEGKFHSILLNRKGEIIGEGSADAAELIDDDVCLRVINNSKWKYY